MSKSKLKTVIINWIAPVLSNFYCLEPSFEFWGLEWKSVYSFYVKHCLTLTLILIKTKSGGPKPKPPHISKKKKIHLSLVLMRQRPPVITTCLCQKHMEIKKILSPSFVFSKNLFIFQFQLVKTRIVIIQFSIDDSLWSRLMCENLLDPLTSLLLPHSTFLPIGYR